jgi:catechol 2,3-dioxygenase-like lactoylglutathione lyase family enzyme
MIDNTPLNPDLVIRYVDDVPASRAFYAGLLGREPFAEQPGFAMFKFDSGLRLGLWERAQASPAPQAGGGGAELAILAPDADAVRALHRDWSARGIAIAQEPVTLDFGHTFVATDADGHRIRVYAFSG